MLVYNYIIFSIRKKIMSEIMNRNMQYMDKR